MSYPPVHHLDPTARPLSAGPTDLQISRAAARSYALQQAVAERRTVEPTPRPARISVWQRARRLASRPRPA
jgi:hypothetical protein